MRILLLTQWFTPEPTPKGLAFARQLQSLGHEVEVLTGFPNYPQGKLYPGYRLHLFRRENVDGISIVRVALYPSHDSSGVRRLLNYASFALSASILGPFLVRRPDVIYVYHPPATVALPAVILRLLRRAPFVYDIQDLWPDTLAATGMLTNRVALACIASWCAWTYSLAEKIVVLSDGFARCLQARGVPADKIVTIYNWCDESIENAGGDRDEARRALGLEGYFNVIFAGNMGKAQALESVLDAAALLADSARQVRFVFIGDGVCVDELRGKASALGLENVCFLPRVPFERIGQVLAAADVLLVHLKDDPLFAVTVPSKTQAYLAAGRPILMAVRGDAADLVTRAGAGVCCEPGNAAALAAAVKRMSALDPQELRLMGERGSAFYCRELSTAVGTRRFSDLLAATAASSAGASAPSPSDLTSAR